MSHCHQVLKCLHIFGTAMFFSTGKPHKTRFKPCISVSPNSVTTCALTSHNPEKTNTLPRESGTTKDTKFHYGRLYYPYMTLSHDYNHPTCVRILWENWTDSGLLFHWVNMHILQLWCWYTILTKVLAPIFNERFDYFSNFHEYKS